MPVPTYPEGPYDLIPSNSLLEHIGGGDQRRRLAQRIHAGADRYWVQSPNCFPIEPHRFFPGFQFLPRSAQVLVTQAWPLSLDDRGTDIAQCNSLARLS